MANQGLGAAHGDHAFGEAQVLYGDGHAVKRPQIVSGGNGPLRNLRGCSCLVGHDRNVALILPVLCIDPVEHRFRHFHGR